MNICKKLSYVLLIHFLFLGSNCLAGRLEKPSLSFAKDIVDHLKTQMPTEELAQASTKALLNRYLEQHPGSRFLVEQAGFDELIMYFQQKEEEIQRRRCDSVNDNLFCIVLRVAG